MDLKKFGKIATAVAMLGAALAPATAVADDNVLDSLNAKLADRGAEVRVSMAEIFVGKAGVEKETTIIANHVGNKQLSAHFVPGDPNRGGFLDITWLTDMVDGAATPGLTAAVTDAAISNGMETWQDTTCSTIPLTRFPDLGIDWGYVQYLLGMGGVPGWLADLTHAGWLPRLFFDSVAPPDGGDFILGATFTFIWIDTTTGDPTDLDGNGKDDVAFREIYYNDEFAWSVDGATVYDVESVALHEAGHGLSQAHFGKVFVDTQGYLKFAPKAVMNAVYTGVPQHELLGTDNAGHCSIWGPWPNN